MDLLGSLLGAGSVFDWITPTAKIGQNLIALADGGSFTYLVDNSGNRTMRQITKELQARGIKTWGHMIVNGQGMFTVLKRQKQFADSILRQMGVSFV